MASMTDPSNALHSFQEALLNGGMQLQRGAVHSELYLNTEGANGQPRFTFVTLEKTIVTAFVNLVLCGRIEGTPCFQIGYAVPEAYRRQGRAKTVVSMALAELQHGFSGLGPALYVEAIVGVDNAPSQRVAEQTLSATSEAITDAVSGLPALRYVRKMDLAQRK
jgi:hypothetical protein